MLKIGGKISYKQLILEDGATLCTQQFPVKWKRKCPKTEKLMLDFFRALKYKIFSLHNSFPWKKIDHVIFHVGTNDVPVKVGLDISNQTL